MSTNDDTQEKELNYHSLPPDCGAHAPLPFHELDNDAFDAYVGVDKALPIDDFRKRGNYVASYVLAQHRIQAKKYQPRWKNLKGIFVLPIELLVRIFETLHPIDLYHIILTTRALRTLLLSKSASSIWERSFRAYPDIPFYPADVSAPKWASLLFGPATCDDCGRTETLVDLTYRTRKCDEGCSDLAGTKGVDWKSLHPLLWKSYYPIINEKVWGLVRETYSAAPHPRLRCGIMLDIVDYARSPKYSKQDVTEMAFKMARYLEDVSSAIPGAAAAYDMFFRETRVTMRKYLEHVKISKAWSSAILAKCVATFKASIPKYCDSIAKIISKRGHDPRDIAQSRMCLIEDLERRWYFYSEPVLTKKSAWKSIEMFDEMVADQKEYRLEKEHDGRVEYRRNCLAEFYARTAKVHISPEVAPFLPSLKILQNLPLFHDFLHDREKTIADVTVVPDAEGVIRRFVASVIRDKKQYLVQILADAGVVAIPDGRSADDVLGLATALFQCCQSHDWALIGWDEAGVRTIHPRLWSYKRTKTLNEHPLVCDCNVRSALVESEYGVDLQCRFVFSTTGRYVLKGIAALLSVNWRVVRAKTLDALGKRFVCKTCPFRRKGGAFGLNVMDWRECINHGRLVPGWSEYGRCRRMPAFALLSNEMTRTVYSTEVMHPAPTELAWACCHCTEFLIERVTRAKAIEHAWTNHGISKPVVDRDFFYHQTERSLARARKTVFVGLDAKAGHRCLHCTGRLGLRVRIIDDLMKHLRHGHEINPHQITEGVDWVRVKLVEDEAWLEEALREQGLF